MRRRDLLTTVSGIGLAGLAGCSGDGGSDGDGDPAADAVETDEVAVGPDGSLAFDPETIAVSTGTTVTWQFESPSHNVSCHPDHTQEASLPEGADPFTTYEGENTFDTVPEGETFEHTFEVAGTYDYVCVPHVAQDMVGTVVVEE